MARPRLVALIAGTSGAKLYSMGLNILALALTAGMTIVLFFFSDPLLQLARQLVAIRS